MPVSDCPKCWNTPCNCEYLQPSNVKLRELERRIEELERKIDKEG